MLHRSRAFPLTIWMISLTSPLVGQETVRIIQTNAAGDSVHIIDPRTNEVVDVIPGISIAHGVTSAPDGSALYFSNEVDHTLDIVPMAELRVVRQIPLTGRPNNVAITGEDAFVGVIHLDVECSSF